MALKGFLKGRGINGKGLIRKTPKSLKGLKTNPREAQKKAKRLQMHWRSRKRLAVR